LEIYPNFVNDLFFQNIGVFFCPNEEVAICQITGKTMAFFGVVIVNLLKNLWKYSKVCFAKIALTRWGLDLTS
jgi:hypothetical protein